MTVPETGAPYSAQTGAWKGVKDWAMALAAGVITLAGMNVAGIVQQCPEATVGAFGVAITLKALLQFVNNYRKNA